MPGTLTTGQGVKEMEEKKLFAVLQEERELLHKQLQLLAEQSKSCTPTELAKLSTDGCYLFCAGSGMLVKM